MFGELRIYLFLFLSMIKSTKEITYTVPSNPVLSLNIDGGMRYSELKHIKPMQTLEEGVDNAQTHRENIPFFLSLETGTLAILVCLRCGYGRSEASVLN